jgi:hypothetical protein
MDINHNPFVAENSRFMVSMSTDEMMKLYFALRSERDIYLDELLRSPNRAKPYVHTGREVQMCTVEDIKGRSVSDDEEAIPADIALHGDINYEDLMFYHEQLHLINRMLFDLEQYGVLKHLQVD